MPNPPSPLSDAQLEAWAAVCEAATSGEWTHETEARLSSIGVVRPHFWTGQTPDNVHHFVHFRDATHHANAAADAEFIATARTALPTLLAAYRDRDDAIEMAWVIICNASGGNWDLQSEEWREAARKWGDANYGPLSARRSQQDTPTPSDRL